MSNFWEKLNKPFFVLAPMEEVTDVAFREMFARYSGNTELGIKDKRLGMNPFVMYTEFVNVDGLTHPEGYKRLSLDLKFTEIQRPMVAQIWGRNPDKFFEAAKIVAGLGFDGVDINMGCPQDKEIGQGTCAALIREPKLAGEIILATIEGAKAPTTPSASQPPLLEKEGKLRSYPGVPAEHLPLVEGEYLAKRGEGVGLPVSVKTRLGYSNVDEMEGWVSHLLKFNIAALALHGRTKQEKSKVPAHWDEIKKAVDVRNKMFPVSDNPHPSRFVSGNGAGHLFPSTSAKASADKQGEGGNTHRTLIIGNGDIKSRAEGLLRIQETGCDGVMIGRGAFGNPWFFRPDNYQPTIKERLSVMLEHAELFQKEFGPTLGKAEVGASTASVGGGIKPFQVMRKHFKAYASGFDGANELRAKLMETKNLEETKNIVKEFLGSTANLS